MSWVRSITFLILLHVVSIPLSQALSPIVVKNITALGPQLTPDVTNVSRDGGYSAMINGNIVWLYDDTECTDLEGNQLSFISNTAAYATQPSNNVSTLTDFGVVNLGTNSDGSPKTAILAGTTVGTGGWIPFQQDELDYNEQMKSRERVAIWPGTSPTSISTTQAFLYAPLVYVDSKPQDPSKEYQARGMTLITIMAPSSGPIATRQGDIIIPGTEVAFGGFSTLLGSKSTDSATDRDEGDLDVYLLGMTNFGLQLARVGINDLTDFGKYTFWNPQGLNFTTSPPELSVSDSMQIYLSGSFSSGSVFYSPYFETFIMVYFNKMVDSTFYARYLQLAAPIGRDATWVAGGKNGKGIVPEDVEALTRYSWSPEQKLWASPPGEGGFNYAGMAHPEYFNTQYYPKSLYPKGTSPKNLQNPWYGSSLVPQTGAVDGKNLLLSWTSQKVGGGTDNGIYEILLATLEFDDIPHDPASTFSSAAAASPSSATPTGPPPGGKRPDEPASWVYNKVEHGNAALAFSLGSVLGYASVLCAGFFCWRVI